MAKILTGWMAPKSEAPTVSRDDFHMLANMGRREGVINAYEARAINTLLAFRGLTARDVMTPRTVMATLSASIQVGEILPSDPSLRFSRIPIYNNSDDDIVGFVRKDDIYKELAEDRLETTLDSLKRELLSALEVKALPDLVQTMVDKRIPITLVVSEYGDPLGVTTMEDLVETMLGMEIVDESDSHIDMQERARELWRLRATASGLDLDHDE
jgi:CBS domain containing-hemolysin-like protein